MLTQHLGLWSVIGFLSAAWTSASNLPCSSLPEKRVVSIADLHGDYENFAKLLTGLGIMGQSGEWIGNNTVLVQTGDVVDRGPDSHLIYAALHRLQDEAPDHGGRVILLFGNHEIMNLGWDFRYVHTEEHRKFGGATARAMAWRPNGSFGKVLLQRHQAVALVEDTPGSGNGVLFVHAGLLPEIAEGLAATGADAEDKLNKQIHNLLQRGTDGPLLGDKGPFWTRRFALDEDRDVCRDLQRTLRVFGARRMIVGHTVQFDNKVGVRCGGQLILADTLISSHYTGQSYKSAVVIPNLCSVNAFAMDPHLRPLKTPLPGINV